MKRFIFIHNVRHPAEMAEPEINAFLTHLAVKDKVSSSTQNQALSALLFFYRYVSTVRLRFHDQYVTYQNNMKKELISFFLI